MCFFWSSFYNLHSLSLKYTTANFANCPYFGRHLWELPLFYQSEALAAAASAGWAVWRSELESWLSSWLVSVLATAVAIACHRRILHQIYLIGRVAPSAFQILGVFARVHSRCLQGVDQYSLDHAEWIHIHRRRNLLRGIRLDHLHEIRWLAVLAVWHCGGWGLGVGWCCLRRSWGYRRRRHSRGLWLWPTGLWIWGVVSILDQVDWTRQPEVPTSVELRHLLEVLQTLFLSSVPHLFGVRSMALPPQPVVLAWQVPTLPQRRPPGFHWTLTIAYPSCSPSAPRRSHSSSQQHSQTDSSPPSSSYTQNERPCCHQYPYPARHHQPRAPWRSSWYRHRWTTPMTQASYSEIHLV